MKSSRVAVRYAQAVMQMAAEENSSEQLIEDFRTISFAIGGSRDLRNFIASPIIDDAVKGSILKEIFAGKIGPLAGRLIDLVVTKGRAADLPDIVAAYEKLIDEQHNIVSATITTAVELDDAQRRSLEERLASMSGRNVRATYVIDPSLIGGFTARFEDKMIDASVRHQLERLHQTLAEGSMN